jgi:hypothetical protein
VTDLAKRYEPIINAPLGTRVAWHKCLGHRDRRPHFILLACEAAERGPAPQVSVYAILSN